MGSRSDFYKDECVWDIQNIFGFDAFVTRMYCIVQSPE